jgi:hypothetical protein
MESKKGFAIIETLVTTVVLTTALISVYVLFNNIMVREKRRLYYDDPLYVARANFIFDSFFDLLKQKSINSNYPDRYITFADLLTEGTTTAGNKKELNLVSFSCDNEIFSDQTACRNFFYRFELNRIYVSKFDMSYIRTCKNSTSIDCITYNLLDNQTKMYFKTLPYVPGAVGYYIIFEFNDNGEGNVCSNNDCMKQYVSIKYGGTNTIINLK